MLYAVLREGTPRLVVMCVLGAFGAQELHHVVESFADGGYDPGVITCIPYAIVGCLLVQSVWREFQRGRGGGWRPGSRGGGPVSDHGPAEAGRYEPRRGTS